MKQTTMKKYRLLKDLPDARAGDIYIQRSIRLNEFENSMRVANCISANWIVDNQKWFEEVKDEPRLFVTADNYVLDTIKSLSDEAIAEGYEVKGFLGVDIKFFKADELKMMLNYMNMDIARRTGALHKTTAKYRSEP